MFNAPCERGRGRMVVAEAFIRTLRELRERGNVTEVGFRDHWHRVVVESGEMTWDGWYPPPLMGMAVLFATAADPSRVNFRTFRDGESFVSRATLDPVDGIVLGYASNVHRRTGLPGDFATTVYLGREQRLLDHFRQAADVCREIASVVRPDLTAGELPAEALTALARRGLGGTTHSDTDPDGHNVGHSLPRRLFVRRGGDSRLDSVDQFTIEPQVGSPDDPTLPKIMLHYVVSAQEQVAVCDACEDPLRDPAII
ncbi:M24 family metallopeptidase [Actinosynnema sp. NPDC050436]|uniref:M24 family metallopeptidase n=1 Tax=Actinosynnema sp. NPDC050436 TaxID=3155659 RepID=UPI0033E5886B